MLVLRGPITILHNFTFQWNFVQEQFFEESKADWPEHIAYIYCFKLFSIEPLLLVACFFAFRFVEIMKTNTKTNRKTISKLYYKKQTQIAILRIHKW